MIKIHPSDDQARAAWDALLDIAATGFKAWTLIGAQMVALYGFEHNRFPPRSSLDADILVDVRLMHDGTSRLSEKLIALGFDFVGINQDGIGHRFRKGLAVIDVLAPDGLGARADLTTVQPGRTIRVPGGSQALARTELVEVSLEGRVETMRRPSLLGAILIKARAVGVDDLPNQQKRDLAFLLSLVESPRALAAGLNGRERNWLRRRSDLLELTSGAWDGVEDADSGRQVLGILIGS